MTVEEVNNLLGKHLELVNQSMDARSAVTKLEEESSTSRDKLIAALYNLFRENPIYYCPKCGGIVCMARKYQDNRHLCYLLCCSCRTKGSECLGELEALLEWKKQSEQREGERREWERLPMRDFKFSGTVMFHTEWVVKARDATEARRILYDRGLDFDREHWREDPAENIKRTFVYPWRLMEDYEYGDDITLISSSGMEDL